MVDAAISVGDVAHDLAQKGGKVLVVDVAAATAEEYDEREDFDLVEYKSHPLLDVEASDTVFTCVYLPDEPTTTFSKTYDLPESRLARVPVEEASESTVHPTRATIQTVLKELFRVAARSDMASSVDDLYDVAAHANVETDLVDDALELAEVERHFDAATDDTTDDTDVTDGSDGTDELGDFERGDSP